MVFIEARQGLAHSKLKNYHYVEILLKKARKHPILISERAF